MNLKEYLLTCLSEEASEIIKDVCKAQRFGLDDDHSGQLNSEKIRNEVIDLMTIYSMLVQEGVLRDVTGEDLTTKVQEKAEKVINYMEYSQDRGCLDKEDD